MNCRLGTVVRVVQQLCQSEVQYLHLTGRGDHHVTRLDVSMNYVAGMGRCQRVGDLNGYQQRALQLQRMSVHQLAHVASFNILHGDEVVSFSLIKIEDGADVGMIEGRGQAGFAFKAMKVCFSCSQFGRQNFYYYGAAEFSVGSFVNSSLPADAELFENLVIAERLSNHGFWSAVTCHRFGLPRLDAAPFKSPPRTPWSRHVATEPSGDKSPHFI